MNIVLGVTGGIAAYKAAQLISNLKKQGHEIDVIMTKNACEFITPLTLETLSKNKVSIEMFETHSNFNVEHISLAKKADVFVVAPCTANMIAKLANGIADDMLSTTFLASACPKIICPAMNTNMLENPITQENLSKLKKQGIVIVESESGLLACNDVGKGKLTNLDTIAAVIDTFAYPKLLQGKKILINAGATVENIDPVRYISNYSSGKMGYALAKACYNLGAEVTLVSGNVQLKAPRGVKVISAVSSAEMAQVVLENKDNFDAIILASAVCDYKPKVVSDIKLKKQDNLSLELVKTTDILKTVGETKKDNQILIGFALETNDVLSYARKKLLEKNCDFIVANSAVEEGAGFLKDTNKVTIIGKNDEIALPLMSKEQLAYKIISTVLLGGQDVTRS